MSKAYVNGIEVIIYDFKDKKAKCYIPDLDICNWYNLNQIEVKYVEN